MAEERAGSWAEIAEFRRVIQVREPFERLLSAYRFTFQNKNRLRDNLQLNKKILQAYPHLPHEKVSKQFYYYLRIYNAIFLRTGKVSTPRSLSSFSP